MDKLMHSCLSCVARARRSALIGAVLATACAPAGRSAATGAPVATAPAPLPGAPTETTAFVDVTVVPMDTERVLPNHTVLVEGGWITVVGPVGEVEVPAGAVRVEGRGKYLMPGLADMHVHIPSFGRFQRDEYRDLFRPSFSAEEVAEAERMLFFNVANGVTTVRVMNGRLGMLTLRGRAANGELWSPRIVVSSSSTYSARYSTDELIKLVESAKAAGYDLVKMYADGSPEAWDSVVATAKRVGLPIAGHAPTFQGGEPHGMSPVEAAIRAGYRSIDHETGVFYLMRRNPTLQRIIGGGKPGPWPWSAVEDTSVRMLAAELRRADTWLCPTMVASLPLELKALPERRYFKAYHHLPDYTPAEWNGLAAARMERLAARHGVPFTRRLIKELYEAGAGVLLGTDAGAEIHGFGVHRELQEFVAGGLRPYDALVIGTRNAAEFLGELDKAGTVAAGKRADLVLLSRNPLEDIRHAAQPAGVMLGGRWLGRAALDARLEALEGTLAGR
jgi:imidazolonepropionase-like amidohydrolase